MRTYFLPFSPARHVYILQNFRYEVSEVKKDDNDNEEKKIKSNKEYVHSSREDEK